MPEAHDQAKRSIIRNIFIELGDLFTQNLPIEGITNILIDHVPSSSYRMILTGYLRAVEIGSTLDIKAYIEKKLDMKDGLTLPPEDIITIIHELLVCEDSIRNTVP